MRTTTLATTVSALAAAALLTGAGTATAEQIDEVDTVDLDTAAGCVYVPTFVSGARCMNLEPAIIPPDNAYAVHTTNNSGQNAFGLRLGFTF